jgi:AraC family transcriptional regulator
MNAQRHWHGMHAAVFNTPPGMTRTPASESLRLGVHLGRPVRARCRVAGLEQSRLQSRGDADLVPAGESGTWEDDRTARILRLVLAPSLIASTARDMGLYDDRVEFAPRFQIRDPRIHFVACAIEAEIDAPVPSDPLYGDSLAIALASHLIRRHRASVDPIAEPDRGLSPRALARVVEYIEAHLDGALSLRELATVAGVSASHFKTLFKRSIRMSAHTYVVRRRVERARALIEEGRMPLAEVALSTGFSDQSHLARWMRRIVGTRPSMIRRSRR